MNKMTKVKGKITQNDKNNGLPKGWEVKKLGEVCIV
jgi:hypothetical protein